MPPVAPSFLVVSSASSGCHCTDVEDIGGHNPCDGYDNENWDDDGHDYCSVNTGVAEQDHLQYVVGNNTAAAAGTSFPPLLLLLLPLGCIYVSFLDLGYFCGPCVPASTCLHHDSHYPL